MTLQKRFFIVAAIAFSLTAVLALLGVYFHGAHNRDHLEEHRQAQTYQVNQLLELAFKPLQVVMRDYGWWAATVHFLEEGKPGWANANLGYLVESDYEADRIWLFNRELQVVSALSGSGMSNPAPTCLPPSLIESLPALGYTTRFFELIDDELVRIELAAVQDGTRDRQNTPIVGYLVGGHILDLEYMEQLREVANALFVGVTFRDKRHHSLAHQTIQQIRNSDADRDEYVLEIPLKDVMGEPFADLVFGFHVPHLDASQKLSHDFLLGFLLFGLLVLGLMVWLVSRLVLRPLKALSEAVDQRNRPVLEVIKAQGPTELAHPAALSLRSLDQESALQSEINRRQVIASELERSGEQLRAVLDHQEELARNLHDGLIQELYASGLNLAVIRESLPADPHGKENPVAEGLDRVIRNLNSLIADVRNFIVGLEPSLLYQAGPEDVFERLRQNLIQVAPEDFVLSCDEGACQDLDPKGRLELYFMVR